jgi:hypothetical protein
MAQSVVFFDMTIGGAPAGRIEMTLRGDIVPKTAEVRYHRTCVPRPQDALARPRPQPSPTSSVRGMRRVHIPKIGSGLACPAGALRGPSGVYARI